MGLFAEPADTAATRRLITMQRERQSGRGLNVLCNLRSGDRPMADERDRSW